jgi:hypothetical protein
MAMTMFKARADNGRSTLSSLPTRPKSCSYCINQTAIGVKLIENRPTSIRATGTATGYAIFNIIVILLTQITPLAIEEISWRYFLIFVICDAIFIVIFVLFYPETKNKTLEEIAALFGDEVRNSFYAMVLGIRADSQQVAETLEEAGTHKDEVIQLEHRDDAKNINE